VADEIAVSIAAEGAPPAPADPLPTVPVRWVRDDAPYRGPLFGLLHGFRALSSVERLVAMPVDMPFLSGPWLRRLLDGLEGQRGCAFRWQGYTNALTAAYRADLLPRLEQLVAEGKQRPIALLDGLDAPILEVETLWRPEDGPSPMLDTDTPEDYRTALLAAGFGAAAGVPVTVRVVPRPGAEPPTVPLRARTAGDVRRAMAALWPEHLIAGGGAVERPTGGGLFLRLREDDPLAADEEVYWSPQVVAS
jgi:molybdopterin-guanine dinucleotide biosynthesis protein A